MAVSYTPLSPSDSKESDSFYKSEDEFLKEKKFT